MLGDVALDCGLQVNDAGEGMMLQMATREGGEEAFDRLEQGG